MARSLGMLWFDDPMSEIIDFKERSGLWGLEKPYISGIMEWLFIDENKYSSSIDIIFVRFFKLVNIK